MTAQRICIVGGGWRADFYHRICRTLPDEFVMVGASARSEATRARIAADWDVPVFADSRAMCAETRPDFAINCGGWNTIIDVMRPLHAAAVPVLCETPPGFHEEQQHEMHAMVREGLRMQVAEQVWLQPDHQARLAMLDSGLIGRPDSAQVGAGGYHGHSLLRKYLGIGFELPTIHAVQAHHPIVVEGGREGPAAEEHTVDTTVMHVTFAYPDGRIGVLDNTGQDFSAIRRPLIRVRGPRGELSEDRAVFLRDHLTPVTLPLERVETTDLDGRYLKAVQFGDAAIHHLDIRARLTDDELAIVDAMRRMAIYCRTGEEFYSFADAAWDQTIAELMKRSAQEGIAIQAQPMPWIADGHS